MKTLTTGDRRAAAARYSSASKLDFLKVYVAGACAFAVFGHLHSSGASSAQWLLLLIPGVGSLWFGAATHRLPVEKYLVAGVVTGLVGVFWLGRQNWSALVVPSRSYVAALLLTGGACSYVGGASLGSFFGSRMTKRSGLALGRATFVERMISITWKIAAVANRFPHVVRAVDIVCDLLLWGALAWVLARLAPEVMREAARLLE